MNNAMTNFRPKTSIHIGLISRIINNAEGFSIKNAFRLFILLPGFILTRFLMQLDLFRYKLIRRCYQRIYFIGKQITDSSNVRLLKKNIKPGNVIIDVGTAFGFYSYKCSKLADPNGQIFAFEPDPMYAPFLRDLVEAKKLSNVKILPYAAWHENAKLELYTCQENPGENSLFRAPIHQKSVSINAVSIDEYVDLPFVNFIKIDVQGAEYYVIHGMENLIRRSLDIVILLECGSADLEAAGTNVAQLLELLYDLDLRVFRCDINPPSEIFKASDLDYFSETKLGQCDLICMR